MLELNEKKEKTLATYLLDEIDQSESDRSDFLDNLETWTELYEGKVTTKTYPWKDCSNVRLPFTPTNCEAIFARMMNSIFGQEPFWMVQPLIGGSWEYAKNLESFLEYAGNHILKIYEVCQQWFLPAVKYGVSPAKITWREDWRYFYKRQDGQRLLDTRLNYRGPKIDVIPLQDFFTPNGYADLQEMPWVGHRFYLNWMQFKTMEKDYGWKYAAEVKKNPVERKTDVDERTTDAIGLEENLNDRFEFYEVYAYYDLKDDGVYVPIQAIVHPATRKVVYVDDYPYDHGRWPFAVIRYMPRENSFYGIGVIQMLEHIQKTLDTHINQIIDNATIANMRWFKYKKGTPLPRNLMIRPGMFWPVDDPNDVVAEQMGDTYQSNPFYIQFLMQQGERRSGLTEYSMGRESPVVGSRATATSTLALIQEANRRFDLTLKDIRNASTEVGYQCLELWQQFTAGLYEYMLARPKVAQSMFDALPDTQKEVMKQTVDFAGKSFRSEVMVELAASRASLNREIEKQNYMALFQFSTNANQMMLGMAQQLENPQVPPSYKMVAAKVMEAQEELAKRIYHTFDIKDAATLVPAIGEFYAQQAIMAQQIAASQPPPGAQVGGGNNMGGGPPPNGGGAVPAGAPQPPPMQGGAGVSGPQGGPGMLPMGAG